MASIISSLPEHQRKWIEHEVESGRYESETSVIIDAVQRAMESSYRWEEDEDLLEAIAEIDRGDGIVVTDLTAYFDQLSREASEAAARGDEVGDDVKY